MRNVPPHISVVRFKAHLWEVRVGSHQPNKKELFLTLQVRTLIGGLQEMI